MKLILLTLTFLMSAPLSVSAHPPEDSAPRNDITTSAIFVSYSGDTASGFDFSGARRIGDRWGFVIGMTPVTDGVSYLTVVDAGPRIYFKNGTSKNTGLLEVRVGGFGATSSLFPTASASGFSIKSALLADIGTTRWLS